MRWAVAGVVVGASASSWWKSSSASSSLSWWSGVQDKDTRNSRGVVHCYRSIDNPLHFRHTSPRGRFVFSQRYEPYRLGEVVSLTNDTALFRFLLHDPNDEFNLKPCSTLQACYKYGVQPSEQCQRFYTPITANHTKGYFDILVKRKHQGQMTRHLFGMQVGDTLLFRSVAFKVQYRANRWAHIGMIAGGTGCTPMLQLIRHALTVHEQDNDDDDNSSSDNKATSRRGKREVDTTRLSFLFCNRSERHILLRGVFDELARTHPSRFRVFYTVDHALDPTRWLSEANHFVGHVTRDMVRATMPAPEEPRKVIMLCGPDALLNHIAGTPLSTMRTMSGGNSVQPTATDINNLVDLGGVLAELGYSNADVYRF